MTRFLIAALALATAFAQQDAKPALEGLDPVLLIQGKEVAGKDALNATHGPFTYVFSTEQTRDTFRSDPDRYGIQLSGACARMGAPVGGSPDAYYVYEGRIYIFGSQECYRRFVAEPRKYLESAQPPLSWSPSAAEREAGLRVLVSILKAHGGSDAIAAIAASEETRENQVRLHRLPDGFRVERTFSQGTATSTVTGGRAWSQFRDQVREVPPAFAAAMEDQGGRDLIRILSIAAHGKLEAASSQPGRLAIREGRRITTLVLDSATGRVASVEYRGRGADGAFGNIAVALSDYRDTGGIGLPFAAGVSIDGTPEPALGWRTSRITLNPANLEARFAR